MLVCLLLSSNLQFMSENSTEASLIRPVLNHKALYTAFDVYPTAKGSSTHIHHFAQTLFKKMQGGWLHVLGSPKLAPYQNEQEGIEITRFMPEIPNFLERTQAFGANLLTLLQEQTELEICHFRDPWSGIPILFHQKNQKYLTVFEVNGLPSIELPYRYPKLTESTLQKIRNMEVFCWEKADYLLTPSQTIKENLIRLGAEASKIKVIYNGAEIPQTFEPLAERPKEYILYFGALQAWQGLETLLKAFTYLQDYEYLRLVICSSNRPKFSKYYLKLIEKLGLEDRIIWHYQLHKRELYQWIREASLTVAPLKECSRNLEQGCCPLKILESMALATPVIASDLPAVREIIENQELGILARPDRPTELARQIRLLLEHPEQRKLMGQKAQAHILQNFTWENKQQELTDFYSEILGKTF